MSETQEDYDDIEQQMPKCGSDLMDDAKAFMRKHNMTTVAIIAQNTNDDETYTTSIYISPNGGKERVYGMLVRAQRRILKEWEESDSESE